MPTTKFPSSTGSPGQLAGTATNDNAAAGNVGEYQSANASTVSVVSNTPTNITSISLTPGDWDVTGLIQTNPAGTTTTQALITGVSTATGAFGTITAGFYNMTWMPFPVAAGGGSINVSPPVTRISVAVTTTVFLVAQCVFAVSTMTLSGFIRARRVR